MNYFKAILAIFWKDLLSEKRTLATLGSMVVFALIVIFFFVFSFNLAVEIRRTAATGVIWATLFFAGTLSLDRTLASENEADAFEGLMLSPHDRTVIFASKALVNWLFLLVTAVVVILAYALFNNLNLFSPGFMGIVLLGTLGYILVGTLVATLTQQLKARGLLLPVLLFPLLIPLMLAVVNASDLVLNGGDSGGLGTWLGLLVGYDMIFLALGLMIFNKILEE